MTVLRFRSLKVVLQALVSHLDNEFFFLVLEDYLQSKISKGFKPIDLHFKLNVLERALLHQSLHPSHLARLATVIATLRISHSLPLSSSSTPLSAYSSPPPPPPKYDLYDGSRWGEMLPVYPGLPMPRPSKSGNEADGVVGREMNGMGEEVGIES